MQLSPHKDALDTCFGHVLQSLCCPAWQHSLVVRSVLCRTRHVKLHMVRLCLDSSHPLVKLMAYTVLSMMLLRYLGAYC